MIKQHTNRPANTAKENTMNLTHNAAMIEARKGNWTAAWKIAQQDDGLLDHVTFTDWKNFAERTIARPSMIVVA